MAEHLAIKPAQLGKLIRLVERERAKKDAIAAERDILDAAEVLCVVEQGLFN